VVGTYRDVELSRQHHLFHTLGELTREPLFRRLLLEAIPVGYLMVSYGLKYLPYRSLTDA
jgi:hypothetical protein